MKYPLFLLLPFLLFCQVTWAQCPNSLVYGDPEWPNKITFSDGSTERTFYFKEMLAIAGEGRFWVKSPTFQYVSERMEGRGNAISLMYFADEAEPDYTLSFRNFTLETEVIDCFELPKKFGDGFGYERSITPRNYRTDEDGQRFMSATVEVRSKRDEGFMTAELDRVHIIDQPVTPTSEVVVLRTEPDTLRGRIMYNKAYNPDTRDKAGLTVKLEADTLHRFSLFDFAGRPGTFHFFNQLFEVSELNDKQITLDRYEVDRERVKEIAANTFFDFNLATTIAETFPKEERKHLYRLSGPYSTYHGEQAAHPEDVLTGYTYDAYDQEHTGSGFFEPFETVTEEKPLSGKDYVRFRADYRTALQQTDKSFTYTETLEKDGAGFTLNASLDPLSRKMKSRGAEPSRDVLRIDRDGMPAGRTYRGSKSNPGPDVTYISGSTLRIAAETEEQGAQETVWNRGYEIPDLLQMNMVLASVDWEDGMLLEFEFQDFITTQSFVNRSGIGDEGTTSYSKKAITPRQAMIKAEALETENVQKVKTRKVAVYHKDYGAGTPLLHRLTRSVPDVEPYKLAGYFWFAVETPGLVQVADAEGNVVFEPK